MARPWRRKALSIWAILGGDPPDTVLSDHEYYFKPLSGNGANVIGSSNAESGRARFR
jgi:hypothetical protein